MLRNRSKNDNFRFFLDFLVFFFRRDAAWAAPDDVLLDCFVVGADLQSAVVLSANVCEARIMDDNDSP